MKTPRFIYFDMGNVLLHFSHERACTQMAETAGMAPETMRQLVFGDDGLEWQFERGDLSEEAFLERLSQAAGKTLDLAAIRRANNDIFELNVEIVPLLTSLRCSDQSLGVFSNTSSWHWAFVQHKYSIFKFFKTAALSFELNALKPEPAAYSGAMQLANCAPEEILFVDDRAENVAAAVVAGFQAVQFTDARVLREQLREHGVRFNL